jgi:Tfp pilus assembly protein PilF
MSFPHRLLPALLLAMAAVAAGAAPFLPTADTQVLERLPARASDPRAQELQALRQAWRQQPRDVERAVRLAERYFDAVAAEGDPRYIGYAQAALAPWWDLPAPPAAVRVLRAKLLQFDHRFAEALADLDAVLQTDPAHGEAWAWRAAIHMVRADYAQARRSCEQLAALAPPLIGVACAAQVDAATGRTEAAASALRNALAGAPGADPAQRLWALTRLAETEERRGAYAAAESAFRQAAALDLGDVYLLAAYADFLLDRGRPAEVLTLLKDRTRADVLLLRLALAAQAAGTPEREALARSLGERFDAAALRGDTTHRKEASRYRLALRAQPDQALLLARENFAEQREPADARILLEAALAARQAAAATPALAWMAASGIQSIVLQGLVDRIKALP